MTDTGGLVAADLAWAIERVEVLAKANRDDAGRLGAKVLKGYGYPNEVMSYALDALALDTVLAALRASAPPEGQPQRIADELRFAAEDRTIGQTMRAALLGWAERLERVSAAPPEGGQANYGIVATPEEQEAWQSMRADLTRPKPAAPEGGQPDPPRVDPNPPPDTLSGTPVCDTCNGSGRVTVQYSYRKEPYWATCLDCNGGVPRARADQGGSTPPASTNLPPEGGHGAACESMQHVRDGVMARCTLMAGHLGAHEATADGEPWWWNEHGHGILRLTHPTTGKPLGVAPEGGQADVRLAALDLYAEGLAAGLKMAKLAPEGGQGAADLADLIDDHARALWSALCEGDGEHSEELDRGLIEAELQLFAANMRRAAPAVIPTTVAADNRDTMLEAWERDHPEDVAEAKRRAAPAVGEATPTGRQGCWARMHKFGTWDRVGDHHERECRRCGLREAK